MGIGDIVAVALGGYAFLAKFVVTRDLMARWHGYEMLFACGIAGVVIVGLMLPIVEVSGDKLGFWPKGVSVWTAAGVLGMPVGFLLASALNCWPGMEKIRLRRLRALAESNSNLIEVLIDDAMQGGWYVELTLESGKSYVGLPTRIAYVTSAEAVDIELIPLFSGYRANKTRELQLTRYYGDDIRWLVADANAERRGLSPRDFRVVMPLRQVVSARLFDPDIYKQMNPDEAPRTDHDHTTC